jgi:hypothetical protein
MALRRCRECTTAFAVGLPACPHCRSTDHEEDGAMPKITRHGGPTIAGASVVAGGWSSEDEPDAWPDLDAEGGEESSPGSSSETSPEKPSSERKTSEPAPRKRARTTVNRSTKDRTASSSARGTDGSPVEGTSAADKAAE